MTDIASLQARYRALLGAEPAFAVRAPGRVNLIGEHTDYNDGYVFPAAIEYDIAIVGAPRADRQVRAWSETFAQSTVFSLDDLAPDSGAPWSNYPRGVAHVLQSTGRRLVGMDVVIAGDVPLGSGLSSSAAIEVAACLAYEAAGGFSIDPVDRALLSQRAEREFVGVQCGIMDQFISSLGRASHALFLDTRTLAYEAVPLPARGVALVVANTNKQRGLVDSEYNTRRRECEEAVALLRRHLPGIRALRDVVEAEFARYESGLPETVRKRARHVITEDERVLRSVAALKAGDVAEFGRLMNASHVSLRDDYGVTGPELDALAEAAWRVPGVYGSRMTGAGFGGCTVSMVREDAVETFMAAVGSEYRAATGLDAAFYVTRAADGASRLA